MLEYKVGLGRFDRFQFLVEEIETTSVHRFLTTITIIGRGTTKAPPNATALVRPKLAVVLTMNTIRMTTYNVFCSTKIGRTMTLIHSIHGEHHMHYYPPKEPRSLALWQSKTSLRLFDGFFVEDFYSSICQVLSFLLLTKKSFLYCAVSTAFSVNN